MSIAYGMASYQAELNKDIHSLLFVPIKPCIIIKNQKVIQVIDNTYFVILQSKSK